MPVRYRAIKQWGRFNTYLFKKRYNEKLQQPMPPFEVSPALKELNVTVFDPNQRHFWDVVDGKVADQRIEPITEPKFDCYTFDGSHSLAEGIKQALNLMNAVGRPAIPDRIKRLADGIGDENLESYLKTFILYANQWESTEEKLPIRRDPTLWWIKWPRYYGIPSLKKSCTLLDSLFQQALITVNSQLSSFWTPHVVHNVALQGFVGRDSHLLRVMAKPHSVIWSPKPLSAVADRNEVEMSASEPLPDIHPVQPLVDLLKDTVSDVSAQYPNSPDSFQYVNTLLMAKENDHRYPWTANEMAGNAVLSCFAAAVAMANKLYPNVSADVLPEPVVVQSVQCCENKFDFVVVQLNTLNLNTNNNQTSSVKNIVWYDSDNKLYSIIPYWLNMETVQDVNGDVFKKFLAFVAHASGHA